MATHVFFDFFGTLVDYDPGNHPPSHNAPHAFSRRAGVAMAPQESSLLWQRAWDELEVHAQATGIEHSMSDIAARYAELIGAPAAAAEHIDLLITEYLRAWTADIRPAFSALQCLADLAADHRLSVVSNTHDAQLVPGLMRRFGLDAHITDVITSVDVGRRKPDPEIFRAALDRHGVTAADTVFVGDNWTADVEGPEKVGMAAFYVGPPAVDRPSVALGQLPALIRALP
ncbi:HAD family hydrolase [Microbispora sp. CA-102843]|uniref:HAD family hydrolase n=1 Tax=Microbispora sp. CA-102843 TaxID=3239952 RepID=UPI003D8CF081